MFEIALGFLWEIIKFLRYPLYFVFGIITIFCVLVGFYIVLGLIKR